MKSLLCCLFAAVVCYVTNAARAQVGRPVIQFHSVGCDALDVHVFDSLPDDEGLSNVELLFDPLGVSGHSIESYNVAFDGPETDVQSGDLSVVLHLRVIDPFDTAYAAIWAINHAGVDRVEEWHFQPVGLKRVPNVLGFDTTLLGNEACELLQIESDSGFQVLGVEKTPLSHFTLGSTSPTPMTLTSSNSFNVYVCYNATDTVVVRDTLWLDVAGSSCYTRLPLPIEGHATAPIIYAEDLAFKGTDTGATDCKFVRVWNRGTAPLIVHAMPPSSPFTVESNNVSIDPDSSHYFQACFAPHNYQVYTGQVLWQTNMDPHYTASWGKQRSTITGESQHPGLHWDTSAAFYDPVNGTSNLFSCYITNTSSTPALFDRIEFAGKDSSDFLTTNSPSSRLVLQKDTLFLSLQFKPDLHTLVPERMAVAYILSNGARVDSLFLTGVTGQAAVDGMDAAEEGIVIYPDPASGIALHARFTGRGPQRYELLDVLGRTLSSKLIGDVSEADIDIAHIPNGEYFIRADYPSKIVVQKISIQH